MVEASKQGQSGETRFAPIVFSDDGDQDLCEAAISHVIAARGLGLPELELREPHDGRVVVVARAPSVLGYLEQIRAAQQAGATIFAVNDAHNWLVENGIIPDGFVVFEVVSYDALRAIRPHPDVTYYIASHCHPENFRLFEGFRRVVWHSNNDWPGCDDEIAKFQNPMQVCGGSTTMMRTLHIDLVLGFRAFELYGVDSSFEGDQSHGIGPSRVDVECTVIASGNNGFRQFKTRPYLARQAHEFTRWCAAFPVAMKVYGEGLLPYLHRSISPQTYEDTSDDGF